MKGYIFFIYILFTSFIIIPSLKAEINSNSTFLYLTSIQIPIDSTKQNDLFAIELQLDTPLKVYRGQQLKIKGIIPNFLEFGEFEDFELKYHVDNIEFDGIITQWTLDKGRGAYSFDLSMPTENLSIGGHTINFQVQNATEERSSVASYEFSVMGNSSSEWASFSGNSLNTSANSNSTFTYPIEIKYRNINPGNVTTRAISVDKYMFYASRITFFQDIQFLFCVDIETGETKWYKTYDIMGQVSTPAYADGKVYVQVTNLGNSRLECYDLETGDLEWETPYEVQWNDLTGPIIENGIVYIAEGKFTTSIGAYDAVTGEHLWKYDITQNFHHNWNPCYYNDTIYAHIKNFVALNPSTGDLYYKLAANEIPFHAHGYTLLGSPVIDSINNQVILSIRDYVYAFNLETKEINWTISEEGNGLFRCIPALHNGNLYIGNSSKLMRVDAKTGEITWERKGLRGLYQPVANDYIVAYSGQETVVICDIETMEIVNILHGYEGNLSLSDENLIISSPIDGSITVLGHDPEYTPIQANLVQSKPISCFGGDDGSIAVEVLDGVGGYTYQWEGLAPSSNSTLPNLESGEYFVTIYDQVGGFVPRSIQIEDPAALNTETSSTPEINNTSNGTALVEVSGGSAPYSYSWKDYPEIDTNQLFNLHAGNYVVTIIDSKSCQTSTTIVVDRLTGLNEKSMINDFQIYPNPASEWLTIKAENQHAFGRYTIINSEGKILIRSKETHLDNMSIHLKNIPLGMYFLKIETPNGNNLQKFTILR